jgi:hypothetical protein
MRPSVVKLAVGLLVLDAILGAASVHLLFWLSPSNRGWVLPFQPGVWILALLQVLFALLVARGVNWARWLVTVAIVVLVGDSVLSTSIPMRYKTYPAATVRDLLSYVAQVSAACLLFLPASSAWFHGVRRK